MAFFLLVQVFSKSSLSSLSLSLCVCVYLSLSLSLFLLSLYCLSHSHAHSLSLSQTLRLSPSLFVALHVFVVLGRARLAVNCPSSMTATPTLVRTRPDLNYDPQPCPLRVCLLSDVAPVVVSEYTNLLVGSRLVNSPVSKSMSVQSRSRHLLNLFPSVYSSCYGCTWHLVSSSSSQRQVSHSTVQPCLGVSTVGSASCNAPGIDAAAVHGQPVVASIYLHAW